jgi:acetylxylan esterase
MMTNVMLGSYPNLFKAATAYAGVPFGCFSGSSDWSSQCATGQLIKTGAQWVYAYAIHSYVEYG